MAVLFVVMLQRQIIKSALCVKPEDRPEATKLKTDLEEYTHTFMMLKNTSRDSRTV